MPAVVTINRPDVVALVEQAANKLTRRNKTESIALALRRLVDQEARSGTLLGAHPGSVRILPGIDLTAPVIDPSDAEDGGEIRR